MERRYIYILAVGVLVMSISLVWFIRAREARGPSLETFLDNREQVLTLLRDNFKQAPEGTSFATRLDVNAGDVLFPGRDHIRLVVKSQAWHTSRGFKAFLDLTDSYTAKHDQASSETCTARQLLDHFLGGLEGLGVQNRGTPGGTWIAKTQSVEQHWSLNDYTIQVMANVVVYSNSRSAAIYCWVIESY
jgi:hypothetical protein